jgi:hypothetical protein
MRNQSKETEQAKRKGLLILLAVFCVLFSGGELLAADSTGKQVEQTGVFKIDYPSVLFGFVSSISKGERFIVGWQGSSSADYFRDDKELDVHIRVFCSDGDVVERNTTLKRSARHNASFISACIPATYLIGLRKQTGITKVELSFSRGARKDPTTYSFVIEKMLKPKDWSDYSNKNCFRVTGMGKEGKLAPKICEFINKWLVWGPPSPFSGK